MYQSQVTTQEEALSHLFFHCCFKDGTFSDSEIKMVSEKLVASALNKELNFKDQVVKYKSYKPQIRDENQYLNYLISLIRPTNDLALFSYCAELCLSDSLLGASEDALLEKIADVLSIDETTKELIIKVMLQRKVVETQKLF